MILGRARGGTMAYFVHFLLALGAWMGFGLDVHIGADSWTEFGGWGLRSRNRILHNE